MQRFLVMVAIAALSTNVFAGDGRIRRGGSRPIPGQYIVVLNESVLEDPTGVARGLARGFAGKVLLEFDVSFTGFLIETTESVATAISKHPSVAFVEQNSRMTLSASTPSWALDRIDDKVSPRLDQDYFTSVSLDTRSVYAYVIDTGIWAGHDEFNNLSPYTGGPRVTPGYDMWSVLNGSPNESANPCTAYGAATNASHGTAVASAIGGKTMGVTKDTILRPVRAVDCNGFVSTATVIAAIDWVRRPCEPGWTLNQCDTAYVTTNPRLINISLSNDVTVGVTNPIHQDRDWGSLDLAVERAVGDGITVLVAAGTSTMT